MHFTDQQLARVRADTPSCSNIIHLHNSGSSLMPSIVVDTVKQHLDLEAVQGGYEAHADATDAVKAVYASIAGLLNTQTKNIALLESATVAWTRVFTSLALTFKPKDKIVTGRAEYASNYIAFMQAKKIYGVDIVVVDNDETGQLDVDHLRQLLDDRVKLVAVTHVPTSGGLVNPAQSIGALTRAAGVPFLLDACQSVGQLPLDVEALQCDFLTATGRKFLRGPRGTGFLYIADQYLTNIEPWPLDLFSANWDTLDSYSMCADARRFEYFESSLANRIGLGAAIDYYVGLGPDLVWSRIQALAQGLRERLAKVPGVTLLDQGQDKCGIVSFVCDGLDPVRVQPLLREKGLNVGVSNVASTRLDMEPRNIDNCFRPSVHYFNTEDELQTFVDTLVLLNPRIVQAPS